MGEGAVTGGQATGLVFHIISLLAWIMLFSNFSIVNGVFFYLKVGFQDHSPSMKEYTSGVGVYANTCLLSFSSNMSYISGNKEVCNLSIIFIFEVFH